MCEDIQYVCGRCKNHWFRLTLCCFRERQAKTDMNASNAKQIGPVVQRTFLPSLPTAGSNHSLLLKQLKCNDCFNANVWAQSIQPETIQCALIFHSKTAEHHRERHNIGLFKSSVPNYVISRWLVYGLLLFIMQFRGNQSSKYVVCLCF